MKTKTLYREAYREFIECLAQESIQIIILTAKAARREKKILFWLNMHFNTFKSSCSSAIYVRNIYTYIQYIYNIYK